MGMISEFKEFINKGNVMDLAVGVIIGGAFGKIVDSLVGDLMMPVIGAATGGLDFSNQFTALDGKTYATLAEAKKAGAATLAYGSFLSVMINFVLLAFCVFLLVKAFNSMKKEEAPAPAPAPAAPVVPEDVKLLTEIRDLLKK
ncbi:MAG: large conductance mechanosensitive channel protein MscL [Acidobacteria bacterium]|nr:large conductance mechanosensitive channel protein MscL [Acidobacteriota bacterium]